MPITRKQLNDGMIDLGADILQTQELKGNAFVQRELAKYYDKINRQMKTYLERFYGKYAETGTGMVSYELSLRRLTLQEMKEFRKEIDAAIKSLKVDGANSQVIKELTRITGKTNITRLESLKTQINADIASLSVFREKGVIDLFGGVFADSYYRTNFALQNMIGLQFDLTKLTTKQINTALFMEFQNSNLMSRLSASQQRLAQQMINKIEQGIAAQFDLNMLKGIIESDLNMNFNQTSTLVQTEVNRLTAEGNGEAISYVVPEYQIVAILDAKTTEICEEMDGQVFKTVDMTPGVNAPPFHYNCRTTTAPYFNDKVFNEEKLGKSGRAGWSIESYEYGDWLKENGVEIEE